MSLKVERPALKVERSGIGAAMSLYSRVIFPWLLDHAISREPFASQRAEVLQHAAGRVLEIGVGTGLNLPFYPAAQVESLIAIDRNPAMFPRARARRRLMQSSIRITLAVADAQRLPFRDNAFDTIISTWTLCSMPDVSAAVTEIHRVLAPTGQFLFIEHGLSPRPRLARWQHRLTPIQRCFADNCHLDRDIELLIRQSPLHLDHLARFDLPRVPSLGSHTYRGRALKSAPSLSA
jgi:SAM-dependent methyltransferase